jgi:hypothetical protein
LQLILGVSSPAVLRLDIEEGRDHIENCLRSYAGDGGG